jgi:hypothetical protein
MSGSEMEESMEWSYHWRFYWGMVDPASIPPEPEPTPEFAPVLAPDPEAVSSTADAVELQQLMRESVKKWTRLNRKIDRLTGYGYRWS